MTAKPSTASGGKDTPLETRHVARTYSELQPREIAGSPKNARFMRAETYKRLVENLKRDKILTSLPLIYRDQIISGHHRVKAAIEAGIEVGQTLELIGDYSEERLTAIQLAHNSITGEDDPNTLAEMFDGLPLAEQLYSGISDDDLKVDDINLASLSGGSLQFTQLNVVFLPEHADEFVRFAESLGTSKAVHLVASLDDFNELFRTLIEVKRHETVYNTALAMRTMARLANERLEQLYGDEAEDEAQG